MNETRRPPRIVAVAFLARLAPVVRGGGLRGINNYDAGVYFGSAITESVIHVGYAFEKFRWTFGNWAT